MSLARLAAVLADATGIDVETLGRGGLAQALVGRCDAEDEGALARYAERIATDTDARGLLLADLLVHETSFFRYPGSFAWIVEEVRRRSVAGAPLVRVLSAPCSTGQEPASVVMALLEAGLSGAAVQVDAVDVSAAVVERARRGMHGPAALRGLSAERRARFTTPTPEGARLTAEIQAPIRYLTGDLLDPLFGIDGLPYDLVLCRNLLIYLTPAARERVLGTVRRLLAPGGVAFVGHAEVAAARLVGLVPSGPAEAYAVAHELPRALPWAAPSSAPAAVAAAPGRVARSVLRGAPPAARAAVHPRPAPGSALAPSVPEPVESVLVSARRLGQAGRAEEALALLARVEGERTPSPDELHLAAVLERALGRAAEVERSLTRALYLDPRHVPTLRLAALVADEEGEQEKARRLRERAERAAAKPVAGAEAGSA